MRALLLFLLPSCASTGITDIEVATPSIADAQQVCQPAPTIAGIEWTDCESTDGVRFCAYVVGHCRVTLARRDDDCMGAWFELSRECRMPLKRIPGEREM